MGSGALIIAAAVAAVSAPPAAGPAVTSYAPSFFTAASPTTALDMVQRLPGFTFDSGSLVRGFGGAAGNVLINGERPASKDDGLDETLKRIRASSVLRIDVIRGGAPGIDMQGKAVIANVVVRPESGGKLLLATAVVTASDGRVAPAGRAEGSLRVGQTVLEGSLLLARGFDDGVGSGPRTRRSGSGDVILRGLQTNKQTGGNEKITGALETPVAGGKLRVTVLAESNPYDLTTRDVLQTPPGGRVRGLSVWARTTPNSACGSPGPLGRKSCRRPTSSSRSAARALNDDFNADPSVAAITGDDTSDLFALRKTNGESIVRTKVRV